MKLNGFSSIMIDNNSITAIKPKWESAGAPLKRKIDE